MIRALLTISFMIVLLAWLRWEFKRPVSYTKYIGWFAAALIVQAMAGIAFAIIDDRVIGNFIYHAIGGGTSSALLFYYLLKTYGIHYNWRILTVLLFGFVSGLGVINELAEYASDLTITANLFAWDSHDTWRDLTANTSGALTGWFCIVIGRRLIASFEPKD